MKIRHMKDLLDVSIVKTTFKEDEHVFVDKLNSLKV